MQNQGDSAARRSTIANFVELFYGFGRTDSKCKHCPCAHTAMHEVFRAERTQNDATVIAYTTIFTLNRIETALRFFNNHPSPI